MTRSPGRPQGLPRQRFILMLPAELAARVRELAQSERRTLNNLIELLVERGLDDWRYDNSKG